MPGGEFFTLMFEPEVEWGTVLAQLTRQYGADRNDPRWKDLAGMAKARGVVLGGYRKQIGLSRADVARGLGLTQQILFCAEHGLAVDRSGPLFNRPDRYDRMETFQLTIRDHLGLTNIELFDQLVRQGLLELDDDE